MNRRELLTHEQETKGMIAEDVDKLTADLVEIRRYALMNGLEDVVPQAMLSNVQNQEMIHATTKIALPYSGQSLSWLRVEYQDCRFVGAMFEKAATLIFRTVAGYQQMFK